MLRFPIGFFSAAVHSPVDIGTRENPERKTPATGRVRRSKALVNHTGRQIYNLALTLQFCNTLGKLQQNSHAI
jgi:hypothetical protein